MIFDNIYYRHLAEDKSSGDKVVGVFENPFGSNAPVTLEKILTTFLDLVIKVGAVVIVFFVIYSGFLFVTAQGNEGQLTKAKQNLMYVAIGAVILLGAQAISLIIQNTVKQVFGV